jgi:serine/threonine-protein kinase HipA
MRKATVLIFDHPAGEVWEDDSGFHFRYLPEHLTKSDATAVSMTLPLSPKTYSSDSIIPFFDGLIPEGWLLDIAGKYWKINPRDRVGLLFSCCKDCIGAVSIIPEKSEFHDVFKDSE